MALPDAINGSFEFLAGLFLLLHIKAVRKDKDVKGVSILAQTFFTTWTCWNMYYYPHLDQWLSFTGGLFLAVFQVIYFILLIHYKGKSVKSIKKSMEGLDKAVASAQPSDLLSNVSSKLNEDLPLIDDSELRRMRAYSQLLSEQHFNP